MCVPIYNQNKPRENCKMATKKKKKIVTSEMHQRWHSLQAEKVHLVFIISLDEQQTVVVGTDSASQIMHNLFIPGLTLKPGWGFTGLENVGFSFCPFHHFFRDYFAQLCGFCSRGSLSCLQLPWLWAGLGMQVLGYKFWGCRFGIEIWDVGFGIQVWDAGLGCRVPRPQSASQ